MTKEELLKLLNDHEDGFVERKASFQPTDVREAVVAFANSAQPDRPGVVFIGVNPDGSFQGIGDPDFLARGAVDKMCKLLCYPPIDYTTASLSLPEGNILAILVPLSPARPHFSGHAFVREGSRTKKASPQAMEDLIASRNSKAGTLLRMRGQQVSINVLGKQIGELVFESHFNHEYEGTIVSCDAHHVVLHLTASSRTVSEPLEWVIPATDTKRYRPLLIIQRPW